MPLAYIESDQRDLGGKSGREARRYIEEKLGGKAKVAILAFKSQLPETSNSRSGGFIDEIKNLYGIDCLLTFAMSFRPIFFSSGN